MEMVLPLQIDSVKGFLADEEGASLYKFACETAPLGPCLEIGSYCGKSTVYLGTACKRYGSILYALDHHRGSEEHQPGEEYHDPDIYDSSAELVDSFREFRTTLRLAGLEENVVPIVASSIVASSRWGTPLGMVFIDGGHSLVAALCDYRCWAGHIVSGGILAIHDIFPNPADGGQAPHTIWQLAKASGLFHELIIINTLGILRRY
ncbi:MAG: class I SAM-dependent methyltransferase [Geobacteraceae bacterium]